MFARPGVTMTLPGKGVATGATAHYFATNENRCWNWPADRTPTAQWHNGQQEASAAKFTYDPNRHFLSAHDRSASAGPTPHQRLRPANLPRTLRRDQASCK